MGLVCGRCGAPPESGAAAGTTCKICGGPLGADLAPTPPADPFAKLDVVALDERASPVAAPAVATPLAAGNDAARFSPPEREIDPAQLELDPAYLAERAAKLAARAAPPPKKRGNAALVISLLVIAAVGIGVWMLYTTSWKQPHERLPGGGVSIRVTADVESEILIDNKPAGRSPVQIHVPEGTRPITISGVGLGAVSVVPDRDQHVHLTKP